METLQPGQYAIVNGEHVIRAREKKVGVHGARSCEIGTKESIAARAAALGLEMPAEPKSKAERDVERAVALLHEQDRIIREIEALPEEARHEAARAVQAMGEDLEIAN